MQVVTIRRQDHYKMPKVCCACGEPAESGRLMASGSSKSSMRFVNFSFPLCDRCAQQAKIVNQRRRCSRRVGLGIILFLSIVAIIGSYGSPMISDFSFFTFLGGLIFLVPLVVIVMWIAQWLASNVSLDREVRSAFQRVSKAIKIRHDDVDMWGKGYITFTFLNERFADLFQKMNTGVVLPGKLNEIEGAYTKLGGGE